METDFDVYIKENAKLEANPESFVNGAIAARFFLGKWNAVGDITPKHNNDILLRCIHRSGVHYEKEEIFYVIGYYENGKFDYDYSYNEPPFEVLGWKEIF